MLPRPKARHAFNLWFVMIGNGLRNMVVGGVLPLGIRGIEVDSVLNRRFKRKHIPDLSLMTYRLR